MAEALSSRRCRREVEKCVCVWGGVISYFVGDWVVFFNQERQISCDLLMMIIVVLILRLVMIMVRMMIG